MKRACGNSIVACVVVADAGAEATLLAQPDFRSEGGPAVPTNGGDESAAPWGGRTTLGGKAALCALKHSPHVSLASSHGVDVCVVIIALSLLDTLPPRHVIFQIEEVWIAQYLFSLPSFSAFPPAAVEKMATYV